LITANHTLSLHDALPIYITKGKHLTNIRSAHKDQTATMKKTHHMSLEEALQYINDDEYCEVTPKSIRLRKKLLNKSEREKADGLDRKSTRLNSSHVSISY